MTDKPEKPGVGAWGDLAGYPEYRKPAAEQYIEAPFYPFDLLGRVRVIPADGSAPDGVWIDIPTEGLDLPFAGRIVEIEKAHF